MKGTVRTSQGDLQQARKVWYDSKHRIRKSVIAMSPGLSPETLSPADTSLPAGGGRDQDRGHNGPSGSISWGFGDTFTPTLIFARLAAVKTQSQDSPALGLSTRVLGLHASRRRAVPAWRRFSASEISTRALGV